MTNAAYQRWDRIHHRRYLLRHYLDFIRTGFLASRGNRTGWLFPLLLLGLLIYAFLTATLRLIRHRILMYTTGPDALQKISPTDLKHLTAAVYEAQGCRTEMPDDERSRLANLPSQVFYGVSTDGAIALRLLGVPRRAATRLAKNLNVDAKNSLPSIRQRLAGLAESDWNAALGKDGHVYRRAWRIIEGADMYLCDDALAPVS